MFTLYDCWGNFMASFKKKKDAEEAANKFVDLGYRLHYVTDDEKKEVIWVGFKHPNDLKTVLDETKRKTLLWSL